MKLSDLKNEDIESVETGERLKLSSIDNYEIEPIESSSNMSPTEAASIGLAQEGTFGLSDEMAGGLQSFFDLVSGGKVTKTARSLKEQGFIGDIGPTTTGELYKEARDIERERIKQAQEEQMGSYLAGGILGTLPVAVGTGGIGALKGVAGGAKLGAATGAAYGVGRAEEISDIPSEVLTEAATGGILGGVVPLVGESVRSAGKGISSTIADSDTLQNILKSRKYGKSGEKLFGETAELGGYKQLREKSKEIIDSLNTELKKSGEMIGKAKDAIKSEKLTPEQFSSIQENLLKTKTNIMESIADIDKLSSGEKRSIRRALSLIDDYTEKLQEKSLSFKELGGLEKTAKQYSNIGQEALPSPEIAGKMTGVVKEVQELLPENIKQARVPYSKLQSVKDIVGIEGKGVTADVQRDIDKLTRLLASSEKEGLTPKQRTVMFDQIQNTLDGISPELSDKLKSARSVAEKYDLIQDIKKQSFLGKLLGATVGGAGGATVGGGVGAAAGAAIGASVSPSKLANIEGLLEYQVGKAVKSATPEYVNQLINNISKVTSPTASRLKNELVNVVGKPEQSRNAAIFALEQNPAFRNILRNSTPKDEDDEEYTNE